MNMLRYCRWKTNQHRFFKGFIKTKGVICMDFRVLLNIYITDNTVSKYLKQNPIRIWNTEKSTIIMQDF